MENLKSKIVDDLKKSGFPCEVSVASELDRKEWIVYNNALFLDSEENKSREIDIHAVLVDYSLSHKKKLKQGDENKLITHLVIEIKKSDKPWIFFKNGSTSWPQIPTQNFKFSKEKNEFCEMLFEDLKKYGLTENRYIRAPLHKSYHVGFSDPSKTSAIFEALVKVNKALKYFKNQYGTGKFVLHYFVPLIVVDGTLWSANINKKGDLIVKEVNKLFVVYCEMNKFKDFSFEEEQICEIVTRKEFRNHIKTIHNDNKGLYKAWTNYISNFK